MLTEQFSNQFVSFLERYNSFYEKFVITETQKLEAMTNDDMKLLDDFVKEEQALLLKSRGLENERDAFMEKSGFPDLTLRNFIPNLFGDDIKKASEIYEKLSDTLITLKNINTRCNSLAQLRLHRNNNEINRLQNLPDTQKAYGTSANAQPKSFGVISKKI